MSLIEFNHVRKSFGEKKVYRDLSLSVHAGETLTVIGGSGVGKSVMLRMLVGLLPVDGGTVHFDGTLISGASETTFLSVRRRIGLLFQGAALFDSLSVGENVAYGLIEQGYDRAEIPDRVDASLRAVGLAGKQDLRPGNLSSGMKKRAGLARAIAVEPEVLLYDEPTTGLDPVNIFRITELITELASALGVTSVVVTHDMPSAFRISDRIAMIHEGRVIFEGLPEDLTRAEDPCVRDFVLGAAPVESFGGGIHG